LDNFSTLRIRNPAVKLLVALGGDGAGNTAFEVVSSSADLRSKTAKAILDFTIKYGFDGVDIDWGEFLRSPRIFYFNPSYSDQNFPNQPFAVNS
jgi:GH18 family chitinase